MRQRPSRRRPGAYVAAGGPAASPGRAGQQRAMGRPISKWGSAGGSGCAQMRSSRMGPQIIRGDGGCEKVRQARWGSRCDAGGSVRRRAQGRVRVLTQAA
eukprot:399986-Prymnesium_polylepis.1